MSHMENCCICGKSGDHIKIVYCVRCEMPVCVNCSEDDSIGVVCFRCGP